MSFSTAFAVGGTQASRARVVVAVRHSFMEGAQKLIRPKHPEARQVNVQLQTGYVICQSLTVPKSFTNGVLKRPQKHVQVSVLIC